ncbi:Zn pept [Geosmithia morbida]|uniref:Zn pept n=1 Tax=Geosmithia morbida TaxID=1094350 RepID=A0A9P5D3A4_9HYPO|nr:Zn pept [Geosmithia morbida]KAF4122341.1 Zn pept [Geosmithia morbida]
MKTSTILGLGIALPFVAAKVSYDGYKVFHVDSGGDHVAVAKALKSIDHMSLGCGGSHNGFDIAVPPTSLNAFKDLGLGYEIVHEDLGADIAAEAAFTPYVEIPTIPTRTATIKDRGNAALPDISYFDSYHDFESHLDFLDDLVAAFPGNSETFVAGQSVEDRPLKGIHLYGAGGPGTKPAIVWHGTVHAREWITTVTVEYLAYQIIKGYQDGDKTITATLNSYDFYIIPVVNPDGFVHAQKTDRLWRKNRQERSGASCVGTDVNRNWPYKWDIDGGSSPDPCDETYRGEAPGDTPENKALTNHTLTVSDGVGLKLYIDWHSYSQLILLPYGYSCYAEASNIDVQMDKAGIVADGIRSINDLDFIYGPTCKTIYSTAGVSMDWVYDIAEAELAWAIELRPGSNTDGGFVIPPSNILPSGKEIWAGISSLFESF